MSFINGYIRSYYTKNTQLSSNLPACDVQMNVWDSYLTEQKRNYHLTQFKMKLGDVEKLWNVSCAHFFVSQELKYFPKIKIISYKLNKIHEKVTCGMIQHPKNMFIHHYCTWQFSCIPRIPNYWNCLFSIKWLRLRCFSCPRKTSYFSQIDLKFSNDSVSNWENLVN